MKTSALKAIITLMLVAGINAFAYAQTDKELLAQTVQENQKAVEALVMYPAETRQDILEVALYPEALIKLENMQATTGAAFKKALEPYSKETQEMVWDITRYPELVSRLVLESGGAKTGFERVLAGYPEEIREKAKVIAMDHFGVLKQINDLNLAAESAFGTLIAAYPAQTRAALQRLLELPEVLSLLTENIRLTILAGDLYRKNPTWVLFQADSLHLAVARRNAQELEDWQKSLDENPQAKEDLMAAAQAYAEENGNPGYQYDDDLYDGDVYDESRNEMPVPIVERHYHHYPYWFGYPYWYDYPRWRPYPWWWDWGFYYSPTHTIVVIGIPSYHFTNWYFYHPWHHDRWCHLSDHFVRYHFRHPRSGGSITTSVEVWQKQHRTVISKDWLKDDGRRIERFREFSRLEVDRDKYNRENPKKPLDERSFFDRNPARYPETAKVELPKIAPVQPDQETRSKAPARKPGGEVMPPPQTRPEQPRTKEPVRKPGGEVVLPPQTKPEQNRKPVPVPTPKTKPETQPARVPRPTQPELNKGREYHENTAVQNKSKDRVAPRPAPKVTAPKETTPKTKAPRKKDNSDGG